MSVNQEDVKAASKRLTPKTVKVAFVPPKYDRDGNQLYVELVQEPGESMGKLLTRSLQDGSITSDMIPSSAQGEFAASKDNPEINPRTGQEPISNMESFLAASGQARTQQARGAGAAIAPNSEATKERNAQLQAQDQELLAPSREQNPVMDFLGGVSGRILPVPGGPVLQGAASVAEGALDRLGAGEDAVSPEMAVDAGLGFFGAKLLSPKAPTGRLTAKNPRDLYRKQVNLLQSRGLSLSPLEESKGKVTGVIEQALAPTIEMTPMGMIAQSIRLHRQRPALNKSITSFFTSPRTVLNDDTMSQISREFGREFDDILRGTYITPQNMKSVASGAREVLKNDTSGVRPSGTVFKMLNRFTENNPRGITGEAYTKIRSQWLGKWRAFKNANAVDNADAMMTLIQYFDDAFAKAGTVEDVVMSGRGATSSFRSGKDRMKEYANLRSRWNMFRLTREATETSQGVVSPHKLANRLKAKNQTKVPDEFRDYVDAAASVLRPDVVRSDTASLGTGLVIAGAAKDPGMALLGFGAQPLMSLINGGTTKEAIGTAFIRAGLSEDERKRAFRWLEKEMRDAGVTWSTEEKE